ncbi:SlyX family protein [Thiohalomonas denitrificans]|uniref:Protein SlyX homolog n=1 Tax=Thiohalomonas denitrificans TaxID=415747 RepID=A0A1G5Q860_9GAMM|nr:SlyX family protein [Thiohalomonas denitrificans]SCZ57808.1 SlyX protein [Thiohalomonas denitrificans]
MDLESRLTDLEIRYAHQEEALEVLSREVIEQRRLIEQQANRIEALKSRLSALAESSVGRPEDEPPPPHY